MPSRRKPSSRPRPVRRARLVLGALVLVVVALGLLAIPFLGAPARAEGAKADLEAAKDALDAGDFDRAEASVESARRQADGLQDAMQGIGGDIWSRIPVVGRPVSDVRHLGDALDNLTSVAEIGVDTWPDVTGPRATLFEKGAVDVDTLESVSRAVGEAIEHLDSAESSLAGVHDSALGVGTRLADARNEAQDVVAPLAAKARSAGPMAEALPSLLGGEDDRTYLVALLNPSELRFSGGAPLTLAKLTVRDGELDLGEARDTTDPELFRPLKWRKVKGDRFLRGRQRLSTSTYAPDWPVAGEELLRAWEKLTAEPVDGLIAIDVVALGRLLEFTGPAEVPLYGTLDSTNFAQKLIGDYDAYPDNDSRHELNLSLVPLFKDRLMGPGMASEKIESVRNSARGRHFAMWMRDPDVQSALAGAGLTGDLADTDHDYLAVFSQNTNIGKVDYWQRRALDSEVRLNADGSARVRLTISVHNDSPPYTQPYPDPRGGSYVTRWNGMTLGIFYPRGVTSARAVVAGKELEPSVLTYRDRPYSRVRLLMAPGETGTAVLEYVVPEAATIESDGALAYHLDMTPQGMVVPQAVEVTVTWPQGFSLDALPTGWRAENGRTAVFATDGLDYQPTFTVTGSPTP